MLGSPALRSPLGRVGLRPSTVLRAPLRASRVARSGAHGHHHQPGTGIYAPKYGFAPFMPSKVDRFMAKLMGGCTWLWIMWRCKQDGWAIIGLSNPMQEFEDEWQAIIRKEQDERIAARRAAKAEGLDEE